MQITVRIKIPTHHKETELLNYQETFSQCVSWWLDKCQGANTSSRTKLHRLYYWEAKERFPNLLVLSIDTAKDKAIEAYRSYHRTKGKKSFPHNGKMACFKAPQYRFSNKALILHLKGETLNLPYHIAPRYKDMLQLKHGRGELVKANGHWYFHIPVEIPQPQQIEPEAVIGIDLGLAKLATTSNGKFFRGEQARYTRNHYSQKRAELQQRNSNGSKNAYKVLKRLSGKESRWMRDLNHKISRQIVNMAVANRSAIAIERLEGIRGRIKAKKKVRRMLNSWSFRQLADFLAYKSQLAGVPLVEVDPRHTSTTCPKCRYVDRGNRKSQSEFRCKKCSYQANADFVATTNISHLGSLLLGYTPEGEGCLASAPI